VDVVTRTTYPREHIMNRRTLGYLALTVYIGSVVLANWLTTKYGLIDVGFGLLTTAGTVAIGGAIMTRDLLQDALGRWVVLGAIVAGALLSWMVAAPFIAVASAVTFLIAETVELLVYTPLRLRTGFGTGRWSGVVLAANTVGAVLDTFLFLWIAGFPLTRTVVAGQLVGKAWVTLAVIIIVVAGRRILVRKPATA
jgi:uncharacterized PurR-regulated membrane protein YhhQ (DUF165 family)